MSRRPRVAVLVSTLLMVGSQVASPQAGEPARDRAYRAALDVLYGGDADGAIVRLQELTQAHGGDPMGAYLEALALCWKLEQQPASNALDAELQKSVARAVALADARLLRNPDDARARLARGAAHGIGSRFHLFRLHARDASRAAVRMRQDLLALQAREPANLETRFGLGLYDYYVDVLPRLARMLRFLTGMPAGDRARGLRAIEEAQRAHLHDVEVQVQLYEIYAFYEEKPDPALEAIRRLHRRYPSWPLWGLKRAEHERERLGLYAESAAVARSLLEAEQRRGAGSGGGAVLARLSLGESLLADGRTAEARHALLPLRQSGGLPAARAALLLGKSLELEGNREGAVAHYRTAALAADRDLRTRARAALSSPLSTAEVRGRQLVAQARRARESGRPRNAVRSFRAALFAWPHSQEAALRVAEDDLAHGRLDSARAAIARLLEVKQPQPPWVRPWAKLLQARLLDLTGQRQQAIAGYRHVLAEPYGQEELQREAADGLRQAFRAPSPAESRRKVPNVL